MSSTFTFMISPQDRNIQPTVEEFNQIITLLLKEEIIYSRPRRNFSPEFPEQILKYVKGDAFYFKECARLERLSDYYRNNIGEFFSEEEIIFVNAKNIPIPYLQEFDVFHPEQITSLKNEIEDMVFYKDTPGESFDFRPNGVEFTIHGWPLPAQNEGIRLQILHEISKYCNSICINQNSLDFSLMWGIHTFERHFKVISRKDPITGEGEFKQAFKILPNERWQRFSAYLTQSRTPELSDPTLLDRVADTIQSILHAETETIVYQS